PAPSPSSASGPAGSWPPGPSAVTPTCSRWRRTGGSSGFPTALTARSAWWIPARDGCYTRSGWVQGPTASVTSQTPDASAWGTTGSIGDACATLTPLRVLPILENADGARCAPFFPERFSMHRRNVFTLVGIVIVVILAIVTDVSGTRAFTLNLGRPITVHEGLDLKGGARVLLKAVPPAGQKVDDNTMEAARQIIESR